MAETETVTPTVLKTAWDEEVPGVKSSKRRGGALIVAVGIAMKLYLFFAIIHFQIPESSATAANSITDGIVYAGIALWLGTIAEHFKRPGV